MNYLRILLKLMYIHIAYIAFGLDQEYFYVVRANCFADLNLFNHAIGNYKKAFQESKDPRVAATLGWCYSQIDQLETALKYYRMAYNRKPNEPDIALGLAYVEFYNNNSEEATIIINNLLKSNNISDTTYINEIHKIQQMIQEKKQ